MAVSDNSVLFSLLILLFNLSFLFNFYLILLKKLRLKRELKKK